MGSDFKASQTKKAQLLTEIEYLIDELKYLQRAGENSQTVPIARQLETKQNQLADLKALKKPR